MTGSSPFEVASAVSPAPGGGFRADLDGRYAFADRINGGYLLAVAARAAAAGEGTGMAAVGVQGQYLRPARPGPADVTVTVRRRGRSTGQVAVRMAQDGDGLLEAQITLRAPAAAAADAGWTTVGPPELPPEDACVLLHPDPPGSPFVVPLMGVLEQRLDPACLGFAVGSPTGEGQLRGWVRVPGMPAVDGTALILLADALPPAAFDLGHTGWVPTLSLDVHVLGTAAPGPVRVRQQVHGLRGGLVSQVCDVWDSDGALVAHAVQLAAVAG